MSCITWSRAWTAPAEAAREHSFPLYEGHLRLANAAALERSDEALVELPDPRSYRALHRAALLLIAVGLEAREALAPFLAADPFSVGIYCAMENGPNDYNSARHMLDTPPEEFAARYKALRSAKHYFKQLANVPPAQLAIFLGVMGPLTVFNHSREAALQALDQAEWELAHEVVKAALVCGAFSLEDALPVARTRGDVPPEMTLCEAAAALVLVPDGSSTDWRARPTSTGRCHYGTAHALVTLCQENARPCSPSNSSTPTSSPLSAPCST